MPSLLAAEKATPTCTLHTSSDNLYLGSRCMRTSRCMRRPHSLLVQWLLLPTGQTYRPARHSPYSLAGAYGL
eukprot:scaffold63971_cov25-Prasinocladus_malaysianus.AAC.1